MINAQKGGVPEISEAAKAKAEAMLPFNEHIMVKRERLARFIQEVSDAAKASIDALGEPRRYHEAHIGKFILPEPVDPLYDALFAVVELGRYDTREQTELLRAELAKRGIEIGGGKP